jgi:hypothetical protein
VFVVDDILLTYIVLPYGRRLLGKGQDQLFNWLDSKLGREGRRLKRSMSSRNNEVDVLKDLGQYVKEHPETAETLATAAFEAELETASALPAVRGDEEVLRVVREFFLTPIFEMVKSLEHPAVVPGFLTGTDWLTAIDVRVPSGDELEKARIFERFEVNRYPRSEVFPARIELWTSPGIVGVKHWRPRIWLVTPMDEELARELNTTPDKLADALNELACDSYGTAQQFAEALERQRFVTEITRHHVIVRRAEWQWSNSPDAKGESVRIPWAEFPAGVMTMRAALVRQLGDRQEEQERWIQRLMN